MIIVTTVAEVTHCCEIGGENEQIIKDYAKEHDCSLTEAVENLMYDICIYEHSYETDFNTTEILDAEDIDDD